MTKDRDDRESTPTYDDLPEAVLDFAEENGFSPKLVAFVGEWHDHEVFDCADDPWFLGRCQPFFPLIYKVLHLCFLRGSAPSAFGGFPRGFLGPQRCSLWRAVGFLQCAV